MIFEISKHEYKTTMVALAFYRQWLFGQLMDCEKSVHPEMKNAARHPLMELTLVDDALRALSNIKDKSESL
jgi:hypothetical protein